MSKNKFRLPEVEKALDRIPKQINVLWVMCYISAIAGALVFSNTIEWAFPAFSESILEGSIIAANKLIDVALWCALIPFGAIVMRCVLSLLYFVVDAVQMVFDYRKEEIEE